MGKKSQKKDNKKDVTKKLPVLKRVELNQLLDNLLKWGFKTTTSLTEQWNEYVEMKTILSRIQVIESDLKVKNTGNKGRMASIEHFIEWAKKNGAEFDGIEKAEFPNYELGLAAGRNIKKDEKIITIPRTMIMSLDNVSTSIAPMMSLPMIDSMSNVRLAFWLIVEKLNPDSFWKPYLDILPDKYSTVMNFSVAEMQELKGSSALPAALNQCKNIARQYAFINKFVKNNQDDSPDIVFEILREKFTYDLYWKLHLAVLANNYEATAKIIQLAPRKEYLDIRNSDGETALHLAVLMNQHKVARLLFLSGASPNIPDNEGNTPLQLAYMTNASECISSIT